MMIAIRTLALGLLLVSSVAHAGWFKKKEKPAPPPAPVVVVAPQPPPPPPPPIPLEFSGVLTAPPTPAPLDRLLTTSPEVQNVVQWVGASRDNQGLPFIVVDKANAMTYAFTPHAQLKASAPILLGMARGDEMLVPNDAPMSAIPPDKRITPAGRYLSWLVKDSHGVQVLSIDYDAAISMHIIVKGTPAQKRYQRLASPTIDDNRVSFGCINVPPGFFTQVVSPDFTPARGIVYVLPETKTAAQLFGFQPTVPAPTAAPAAMTAPSASQAPMAAPAAMQPAPVAPQALPVSGGSLDLSLPAGGSQ